MKQTAIEWLIVQIKNDHIQKALTGLEWKKIFDQAKAMEREQIIDAHGDEQSHLQDDGSWRTVTAEHYYNETYKQNI
jgi:hypothetical protein